MDQLWPLYYPRETMHMAEIMLPIYTYMYKSYEICEKKPKYGSKIFFRAHLPDLVFLVVCSVYKRNSWLNGVYRMVYFF